MANYDRNAYAPYATGMGQSLSAAQYDQGLRSYMLGIYNHMSVGLAITALVAVGIGMMGRTSGLAQVLYGSPLKYLLMFAPLAFTLVMSFRWEKMSYSALLGTFYAFAATMGLSMGAIFFVFKLGSIAQTFFITAAAFGALSLYGYTTKKDLTAMGKFMIMGLIGLVLASLVNLFTQSGALQFAINAIGVVVFAGLTAWDTQRLKEEYDSVAGDTVLMNKWSLMGALTLYLNFINMFQMLLSLFGQREE